MVWTLTNRRSPMRLTGSRSGSGAFVPILLDRLAEDA